MDNAANDLRYEIKFENIRNVWSIAFGGDVNMHTSGTPEKLKSKRIHWPCCYASLVGLYSHCIFPVVSFSLIAFFCSFGDKIQPGIKSLDQIAHLNRFKQKIRLVD